MIDPRQEKFHEFYEIIDKETKKIIDIPMEGYPASHINLGKIQKNIEIFIEKKAIKTTEDIGNFLRENIQRMTSYKFKFHNSQVKKEWSYYTISIKTKDDLGWYYYELNVKTGKKLKDD